MAWDHSSERECDWVPGCFYLIRREVLDEVGLFDPRYFMYYEEVDHCRRVKAAGWKVVYFPHTSVVHLAGESAKTVSGLTKARQISELQIESEVLYIRKHHGLFGVLVHIGLISVGDVILFLKESLKMILRRASCSYSTPLLLPVLRAFRGTKGASCATR